MGCNCGGSTRRTSGAGAGTTIDTTNAGVVRRGPGAAGYYWNGPTQSPSRDTQTPQPKA